MTYRGSIPPGQGYNNQNKPPMTYPAYPQYASGPSHTNAQYQNQQFAPAYAQQPAQFYPVDAPQQVPYNGAYDRHAPSPLPPPPPPPPPAAAPVQYVDPSYLQQTPLPSYQPVPLPPQPIAQQRYPQPAQQPVLASNSPRIDAQRLQQQMTSNNSPSIDVQRLQQPPLSSNSPVMDIHRVQQQPVLSSNNSPRMDIHRVQQTAMNNNPRVDMNKAQQPASLNNSPIIEVQRLQQPSSSNNSPRMSMHRLPSQGSHGRPTTAGSRRSSSTATVTKSPVVPHTPLQVETLPLLVCVAEDCFSKARASVAETGRSKDPNAVNEYHKLIATGLGCLEVAMQSNKLWPRLEARLRLRYAAILIEETTNTMEAETALTKGISECEKHRFMDLKYCMQFLFAKVLFQRNQKAALISIDTNISESTTYKQAHWVYAFRFLKASFYLQAGSSTDPHAFENLRKLTSMATARGDKAICVMASLLEGLAHLSTKKEDSILRVQTCIAQASKFQLEASARLPQIEVLLLFLDLACSLHQKVPTLYSQKLAALQSRMDELKMSHDWDSSTLELLLPIKKQGGSSSTISNDTATILRRGDDEFDYLVLPAIGRQQAFALAYTFHGLFALSKSTTPGKSSEIWAEALKVLGDRKSRPLGTCLPEVMKQSDWESDLTCYIQVLIGLQAATLSDWAKVKRCLESTKDLKPLSRVVGLMRLYLTGVHAQGTANLDDALRIFEDPRFDLEVHGQTKAGQGNTEQQLLSILATANRIWIMQAPSNRSDAKTAELTELLRLHYAESPDVEVRTVFNLVLASMQTNPPTSINQIKRHIQQSLNGAQQTANTQCLSIALNIMRCRLFENVVGEQALKSARACSAQAKKSGNLLWMSVAEGMLAQSLEMQGVVVEAKTTKDSGIRLANEAHSRTQC